MDETTDLTDTREMLAVHEALRAEFGALPGLILAVPAGDTERSGLVGEHALLLLIVLHAHHEGEDVIVWPPAKARAPEAADLIATLEGQHVALDPLVASAHEQAEAWMGTADPEAAAALAATVADLDAALRAHLALEEAEFLPIAARIFSEEEWAEVGAHSRAALSPPQLALALGTILANVTPEQGDLIIGAMPPEGQAGWEQFGRPMSDDYRARLYGAAG